jgi:hypothetical protein
MIVTAHTAIQRGYLTNQITIKKSMHKLTCSLSKERTQMASFVNLPSKGNKITIIKNAFEAKSI